MKTEKNIPAVIGILAAMAVVALFTIGDVYVSGKWRYKITVEVETPEGIKTGSAVREVSNSRTSLLPNLPQAGHPPDLEGEAVIVDLGKRGTLFALLKGAAGYEDHAKTIVYYAFPYDGGYSTAEGIRHYRRLKNAKAILPPEHYPMLVMFKDINDPKTVTRVQDMEEGSCYSRNKCRIKSDHFEELFGAGVALKGVTIEMTDEPITWKVERLLTWFAARSKHGGYIGGDIVNIHRDPSLTNVRAIDFTKRKQ